MQKIDRWDGIVNEMANTFIYSCVNGNCKNNFINSTICLAECRLKLIDIGDNGNCKMFEVFDGKGGMLK